jgi:drug/metabolite transporter (DMT)-like permease
LKTGAYSVLYAVISNMAIGLCFVPFLLLGWKKMRQVNTYWVIGIYWLLNGLVNLPELGFFTGSRWQEKLTFGYNLAETPLVLLVFGFATSGRQRRNLLLLIILFMIGEAVLISWKGYNFSSGTVIIGSGLLLIFACCITGLIQYVKRMEHTRFENSMVFVYAALLFAYGSFLIIYLFAHLHPNGAGNGTDSFLLYYVSLLISAAVTSMGLWNYGIKKTRRLPARPHLRSSRDPHYSSSSS